MASFDVRTKAGLKIEVKSAAYLQSWFQRDYSKISFSTRRTRGFDASSGVVENEAKHQADTYVFALLTCRDKEIADPLDLTNWEFYVVPTSALESKTRSQHSITLASLRKIANSVRYEELGLAIEHTGGSLERAMLARTIS